MLKKLLAPFQVIQYRREDGNEAVYKIFRPTKRVLKNNGDVVGFTAWKSANTGTNAKAGYRAFRFDRIKKSEFSF